MVQYDDPTDLIAGIIYEGLRDNAHRTRFGQARAIAREMILTGAAKKPDEGRPDFGIASEQTAGYAAELEELTAAFNLARTQGDDAEAERMILAIIAWLDRKRVNWKDEMLPLLRQVRASSDRSSSGE